jgi:hypothetical protein
VIIIVQRCYPNLSTEVFMTALQQQPQHPLRERAALVSYWSLFIFLPLVGFIAWRGITAASLILLIPLFLVLVLVGERALRLWRRLWRLP